jgi:hypothetical protein
MVIDNPGGAAYIEVEDGACRNRVCRMGANGIALTYDGYRVTNTKSGVAYEIRAYKK